MQNCIRNREGVEVTVYKLDCLYAGKDIDGKALLRGGNAQEALQQQIENELDQLLIEIELQESEDDRVLESMLLNGGDTVTARQRVIEERNKFKITDEQSSKRLSNLVEYDFGSGDIRVESTIDFMDIQFTTDKAYSNRSDLKGALTKVSGTKYFVADTPDENSFSIRLHNVKNKRGLLKELKPLSHFVKSADSLSLQIIRIERALDFYFDDYNDQAAASLALALFKALRIPNDVHDIRFYREKGETFKLDLKVEGVTPFTHSDFIYHLSRGFNIGINSADDDFYYHIYLKKTDTVNGELTKLPRDKWRVRCELRVQGKGLSELLPDKQQVQVRDLSKLIERMTPFTKFVKPRDSVCNYVKTALDCFPRPCGKERSTRFNANRYTQPQLSRSVTAYGSLNKLASKRQETLAKRFAV